MDNQSSGAKIWRPTVQRTDTVLPRPGSSKNQQQLYTKTSLAASPSSSKDNFDLTIQQLNREILSASQSYNNTPKPFFRQRGESPSVQSLSPILSPSTTRKCQPIQQALPSAQQPSASADKTCRDLIKQEVSIRQHKEETIKQQEENMSPKLVHKQYNSPIDLYSMNNIRKTIEAHTELIAPGVKGINFMKPDAQVNKQSDVYKLVMEEEQQKRSPISKSPVAGRQTPLPTPPTYLHQDVRSSAGQCSTNLGYEYQHHGEHRVSSFDTNQQVKSAQLEQVKSNLRGPTCCECGKFILGPFAKIQDRFVHPHCFNCSTCGTSLKNMGYFMVNDKLYCDIHAKQVAKVMQIQYQYNDPQEKHQDQLSQKDTSQAQAHPILQQSVKSSVANTSTSSFLLNKSANNSLAPPISTMFASRSQDNIQAMSDHKDEVKWIWRPARSMDRLAGTPSLSNNNNLSIDSNFQQQLHVGLDQNLVQTNNGISQMGHQQQQRTSTSSNITGRGTIMQEDSYINGRIPICFHCNVQIHGPYILAGKTTWCKHCSQTNFNCSSCRRSLLDTGFIEDSSHKYYCEHCFEAYYAPICSKCNIRIKGDCLNALGKQWHPSCFVCGHCMRPFGNSSFYLEDNVPYCERDWNILFTTKCYSCSYPIEAGDKWVEALERNYHSNCFRCTSCHINLEGSTFYCKGGKPFCRQHAR